VSRANPASRAPASRRCRASRVSSRTRRPSRSRRRPWPWRRSCKATHAKRGLLPLSPAVNFCARAASPRARWFRSPVSCSAKLCTSFLPFIRLSGLLFSSNFSFLSSYFCLLPLFLMPSNEHSLNCRLLESRTPKAKPTATVSIPTPRTTPCRAPFYTCAAHGACDVAWRCQSSYLRCTEY